MSLIAPAGIDFRAIRRALGELPRAENVAPGGTVTPASIVSFSEHRSALDPERALVVGNRGMGKSFWTHALANPEARISVATAFRLPELAATDVRIGFNASERIDPVAPTPIALQDALAKQGEPDAVWRAVLVRATLDAADIPSGFGDLVGWVRGDVERTDRLLTEADERMSRSGRKLLVVFDALDRLAGDWKTTRLLTTALLRRSLAARSYRALRLKLFMRTDQYEDPKLFEFPDGSKIKNTRVDLSWSSEQLYTLLFDRLERSAIASRAYAALAAQADSQATLTLGEPTNRTKRLVHAIAGEFMGADKKRGRVYTWLPLHLADARGETSPRTFLTAWREAALHGAPPADRAVDHAGLLEGVRKASEDRLQELKEDYWWIDRALEPLRNQMVPMDRANLEDLWRVRETASSILRESRETARLAPVQLEDGKDAAGALLSALSSIGVIERRSTGKIDVPDIFRVEAGIKRKGGVKPPRRVGSENR